MTGGTVDLMYEVPTPIRFAPSVPKQKDIESEILNGLCLIRDIFVYNYLRLITNIDVITQVWSTRREELMDTESDR